MVVDPYDVEVDVDVEVHVLVLVLGVFAWSCGLLPYVPWHVTPP